MSNEYINLAESSEDGTLAINSHILREIAYYSISRIKDIEAYKKSIDCVGLKIRKDEIYLSIDVNVNRNINTATVCEQLQNKIYINIFQNCNIKVKEININVRGYTMERD